MLYTKTKIAHSTFWYNKTRIELPTLPNLRNTKRVLNLLQLPTFPQPQLLQLQRNKKGVPLHHQHLAATFLIVLSLHLCLPPQHGRACIISAPPVNHTKLISTPPVNHTALIFTNSLPTALQNVSQATCTPEHQPGIRAASRVTRM